MASVSRSRAAFWGTVVSQGLTILSMLVSIVSTPLMVKYLDKEEYGLSIIFFQILSYLSLCDFGLSAAVIRSLAINQGDDEHAEYMLNKITSTSFFALFVLGVVMVLITCCFAPFIPEIFHLRADLAQPAIYIVISLSLGFLVQFLQRGLGGIFFAHHRQVLITVPSLLLSIMTVIATVILLACGFGLWSFVYANVGTYVVSLIVIGLMLRRYYPNLKIKLSFFDKELLRSLLGFGFFLFLGGLAFQVILLTDRLVIGRILSLTAVAVFSITVRIPEVGLSLLARITDNAGPAMAEILAKGGKEQARGYFQKMMVLINVLAIVAFWVMMIMNEWFIDLWVGPTFFAGQYVLVLALLIMLQQIITRTSTAFLNAKGIARPLSYMAMVEAVLNITMSVYLGYKIGLPGILLGTLLASLLTSSWYVPRLLHQYFGVTAGDFWGRALLLPAAIISLVGGSMWGLVYWLSPSGWLAFFFTGAVVAVILTCVAWVAFLRGPLGQYVPERFRSMLLVRG